MKLQVNLAGSWRDVLSFDIENADSVMFHARALLKGASNNRVSMRVADDKNVALSHCAAPDFVWAQARGCKR